MMVGVSTSTEATSEPSEERRRDPVRRAVQAYAERQPALQQVTERYLALVTTLLDEAGINYLTITGRTKSVASFAAKAARAKPGSPTYAVTSSSR